MPKTEKFGLKKCLVPDCGGSGSIGCHGMWIRCWGEAKRDIEAKRITLEELAEAGLIERQLSPYQRAIKEAQQQIEEKE